MTPWQKAIKYAAFALAVVLCISIIGGIISALATATFLFEADDSIGETRSFSVSDDTENLDIDINAAEFHITNGDTFTVETNNKNIEITEKNKTLYIKEKKGFWTFISQKAVLTIQIPDEKEFEKADINTGAGKVSIETLIADVLEMELGAGEMQAANLTAKTESSIDGGAGKIDIGCGELCNLDLDMGVGELILVSRLSGESDLDLGVGSANILLDDDLTAYKLKINKGLGKATVDGQEVPDGYVYSNGDNFVNIDGGVGSIDIEFASKK